MLRSARTICFLCLIILGCTKDFESINTNPNAPETTSSEYLLSEVLISTAYAYQENAVTRRPASAARYLSLVRNTGYDLFAWGPVDWDDIYQRLAVVKALNETALKNGQEQYIAISKIMNAFNFSYLTDLYGDIPFSEALKSKSDNLIHPSYDKQQIIYPALLKELEEANALLMQTSNTIDSKADVIYKGDVLMWRKFANSLKIRLLMRISKHYPTAFNEMQAILADPDTYPVFNSNSDNAELAYLGTIPAYSWPGGPKAMIDFDYIKTKVSKELVDCLLQRNDPRLDLWVEPVKSIAGATVDFNKYVGVPHAIDAPASYNGGEDHVSVFSSTFFRKDGGADNELLKASMMTYTELCFIVAEALQAGKIQVSGLDAERMYYDGIESAMTYYKIPEQAIEQYYQQPLVRYDGTLAQLITQKWLAMLFKGAEGWFDQRRTGFPAFKTGPLAAGRGIPKRYVYPDSEGARNRENYEKAIADFGADNEYTLMWYLK